MSLDESANDALPAADAAVPRSVTAAAPLSVGGLPRYSGVLVEAPARVAEGGTSGYSIAAMILGILPVFFGILGIVFGFIALSQIKQRGQKGRGNALIGVVGGGVWLAVGIAAVTAILLSS